jgi:hypothetical protein
MGQARPGGGIGLLISPAGSSLPNLLQAATKQITAKATGTMLASVHKCLRLCDLCKELASGTLTRK